MGAWYICPDVDDGCDHLYNVDPNAKTREEAIAAVIEEYRLWMEGKTYLGIWDDYDELLDPEYARCLIGEFEAYVPEIDGERVIEWLWDEATCEVGDISDGWFDFLRKEEIADLTKRLTETFNKWASETGYTPNFGLMANCEEVCVADYLNKELHE